MMASQMLRKTPSAQLVIQGLLHDEIEHLLVEGELHLVHLEELHILLHQAFLGSVRMRRRLSGPTDPNR
jgi:hypothetical protein